MASSLFSAEVSRIATRGCRRGPGTARCRAPAARHRIGPSGQVRGIEDISVPVLGPEGFALAVLTCPFIDRLNGPQAARAEALGLLGKAAAGHSLR